MHARHCCVHPLYSTRPVCAVLGLVDDSKIVDSSCSSSSLGFAGTKRLSEIDYKLIAGLRQRCVHTGSSLLEMQGFSKGACLALVPSWWETVTTNTSEKQYGATSHVPDLRWTGGPFHLYQVNLFLIAVFPAEGRLAQNGITLHCTPFYVLLILPTLHRIHQFGQWWLFKASRWPQKP